MRGRKPTPTTMKLITGNPGHRPMPADEPRPEATVPKCPPHLDADAKKEWRRMAKELEPLGMLTKVDKSIFAMYCEAYSTWANAARVIQDKGMVFTSKAGLPVVNPYFKIATKAKEEMLKALIEMGMTPSSRSRVKVQPQAPQKPKDKERFFN